MKEKVYYINGLKYVFKDVRTKDGCLYGYSPKHNKWAYLFDGYIQFEGEGIVLADKK